MAQIIVRAHKHTHIHYAQTHTLLRKLSIQHAPEAAELPAEEAEPAKVPILKNWQHSGNPSYMLYHQNPMPAEVSNQKR